MFIFCAFGYVESRIAGNLADFLAFESTKASLSRVGGSARRLAQSSTIRFDSVDGGPSGTCSGRAPRWAYDLSLTLK
jgi:hypothetical protein